MNDPPNFEVEQIPGPALLVGGDGSVVRANIHAKRLFGYGDRDGAGLEFEQIIHPEHRHRCRQLLDSAFVDHTEPSPRQTSEFKGVTLDGRQIKVDEAKERAPRGPAGAGGGYGGGGGGDRW